MDQMLPGTRLKVMVEGPTDEVKPGKQLKVLQFWVAQPKTYNIEESQDPSSQGYASSQGAGFEDNGEEIYVTPGAAALAAELVRQNCWQ